MSKPSSENSLGATFVKGSAWLVGVRWAIRISGLFNTYFLVRLLNPSDFGIVAMAMIVVGMVEMFAQTGQKLAVIKHPNPQRDDFDTAWTMSIMFGVAIALAIFLLAPVTKYYFHEPRTVAVMEWLALRSFIGGFENIGVLNFRRDLRFERQFIYLVSTKILALIVTIGAALIYRNYWALVIGMVSSQFVMVILSFVLSPYRPRLCLTKIGEMWSFSTWTMFKTIGEYLNDQVDQLAVGGFSGTAVMGRYRVASDVSSLFTIEILQPMVAVLFPVMASVQADPEKMREVYLRVFQWTSIICISTSVGVALCGDDIVDVLLGSKWGDVKPLVPWLALSAGALAMSSSVYSAFEVSGRPRMSAQLQWVRFLFLAAGVFFIGFLSKNVINVAISRFVVTLALTPTLFMALARAIDMPVKKFALAVWRPTAAAGVMSLAVIGINQLIENTGLARLILDALFGGAVFILVSMALWYAFGRPDSPEKYLRDAALSKLNFLKKNHG